MSTTILKEVQGARDFLGNPLSQFPSTRDILVELEAEYQYVTNKLNNTGNAWLIDDYHLETVANQAEYRLDIDLANFYKPLSVTTIPVGSSISYRSGKTGLTINTSGVSGGAIENVLEFVELEHMPNNIPNMEAMQGQIFGSGHSSEIIAIYRSMASGGEGIFAKLRPTPNSASQGYRILYQVTDWWDSLFLAENTLSQKLPNSSQRIYIRALVALNLLGKGVVRWSLDEERDFEKAKLIRLSLLERAERYRRDFEEYLSSLDNPDITWLDSQDDYNFY